MTGIILIKSSEYIKSVFKETYPTITFGKGKHGYNTSFFISSGSDTFLTINRFKEIYGHLLNQPTF